MSSSSESILPTPVGDVARLAEHLFRHESGKLISLLARTFGMDRLQLAEDVVQEALLRALKNWPYYGIPANPSAWLVVTAKNLALDMIRREKLFQEKQSQIIGFIEQISGGSADRAAAFGDEIHDAQLRLMFACCHPRIPQESQTAIALKTLCGFAPAEIAKAFLTTEAAIAKRLTRARQRIRELAIALEIPSGESVAARMDSVLQVVYLLFNEGYKASSGDTLIREELCSEAIRLTTALAAHPVGDQPRVHALLALMLLNAARLPARTDSQGNILRLEEQDRTRWDQTLIARGMMHLAKSASGNELSGYHLQAAIAAVHSTAADYESTDWRRILSLYDQLLQMDDSPVIALNRAVALAKVCGPLAGVHAIQAIQNRQALESYYLLYAVLAEFEFELKHFGEAANHLRKAIHLTSLQSERAFLSRRLEACVAAN